MKEEHKQLLLKDLCARLPYGVSIKTEGDDEFYTLLSVHPNKDIALIGLDMNSVYATSKVIIDKIKPYLRPMSSITEEEHDELFSTQYNAEMEEIKNSGDYLKASIIGDMAKYDWLNSHHFDYRGLIDNELALEAPKNMYIIK